MDDRTRSSPRNALIAVHRIFTVCSIAARECRSHSARLGLVTGSVADVVRSRRSAFGRHETPYVTSNDIVFICSCTVHIPVSKCLTVSALCECMQRLGVALFAEDITIRLHMTIRRVFVIRYWRAGGSVLTTQYCIYHTYTCSIRMSIVMINQ